MRVELTYFKPGSGKYYTNAVYDSVFDKPWEIFDEVKSMREDKQLPGLVEGAFDFDILVNIPDLYPALLKIAPDPDVPAEGALLTTLKAAANYVCRATSDYYPADVRHTIIKALTYHIAAIEEGDDDPAHWQERLLFASDIGRNQQHRINELERCIGLLLPYADHQRGCTSYTNGPCTCGFEGAMRDPAIAYNNSDEHSQTTNLPPLR